MRSERARRRLSEFLRQAWPVIEPAAPLVWGWHLDAICEHLEAVTRGEILNLLITIPPGSTKSITCSVAWPAWSWIDRPETRWLSGSNVQDLAIRDAVACRRLIESDWYQGNWGQLFQMASDQNVKGWYQNTRTGYRISVTTGTTVTGKKGDLLLLDDPNDAQKVESEPERRHINNWWDKAFFNRVNDHKTGRRVVIGQRLHHDDLIGHIKSTSSDFVELRIPEQFQPTRKTFTPIWEDPRSQPGELLRPDRFGSREIDEAKHRLGPYGFAAQHNQEPERVEGGRFKSEWFRYYSRLGEYLTLGERIFDPRKHSTFMTVDPAASEKTTADWTVISTWMLSPWGDFLWLDCLRVQKEIPDIVPLIQQACARWKPKYVAIETVYSNRAVYQLAIRATNPVVPARSVDPMGQDKLVRATPAITIASTGRLWLPDESSRGSFPVDAVIEELTRFTGTGADDHDDIVDTLAYAVQCEGTTTSNGKSTAKPMVLGGGR